jgi:hypothetical protein
MPSARYRSFSNRQKTTCGAKFLIYALKVGCEW